MSPAREMVLVILEWSALLGLAVLWWFDRRELHRICRELERELERDTREWKRFLNAEREARRPSLRVVNRSPRGDPPACA